MVSCRMWHTGAHDFFMMTDIPFGKSSARCQPDRALPCALAAGVSARAGLPLRFQLRRRVRKARPFERLLSAPSAAHSDFFYQATPLSLNLHVNATTSGIDIKACLCGGKADYHTGLICHDGASFPFGNSHTAGACGTDIIMTVEILKML